MPSSSEKQPTLGLRLREKREELGLSIQDIAREIKVSSQYIHALEEGNYEALSARVYARGFLKRILALFGISDTSSWFEEFDLEWDIWDKQRSAKAVPQKRIRRGPYITPRRLVWTGGAIFLLLFLVFAGIRLKNFTSAPVLIVDEPQDRVEIHQPSTKVRGHTERESRLTVNGREITIDDSGNFNQDIELSSGVNELEFVVLSRFGKDTKVTRYVVVK